MLEIIIKNQGGSLEVLLHCGKVAASTVGAAAFSYKFATTVIQLAPFFGRDQTFFFIFLAKTLSTQVSGHHQTLSILKSLRIQQEVHGCQALLHICNSLQWTPVNKDRLRECTVCQALDFIARRRFRPAQLFLVDCNREICPVIPSSWSLHKLPNALLLHLIPLDFQLIRTMEPPLF